MSIVWNWPALSRALWLPFFLLLLAPLRAEIAGTPAADPPAYRAGRERPLERYVDLHYYDEAVRLIELR